MGRPSSSPPLPSGAASGGECGAVCRLGGLRKKGWNWILRAEQGTGRTGLPLEASIQGRLWRKRGPHPGTARQHQRGAGYTLELESRPEQWPPKKQASSLTGLSSAPTLAQGRAHAGCTSVRGAAWAPATHPRQQETEPCSSPTGRARGNRSPRFQSGSQVPRCFPTQGTALNPSPWCAAWPMQLSGVLKMTLATVSCPLKSMGIFSTVKKVNLKRGAACLLSQVTN